MSLSDPSVRRRVMERLVDGLVDGAPGAVRSKQTFTSIAAINFWRDLRVDNTPIVPGSVLVQAAVEVTSHVAEPARLTVLTLRDNGDGRFVATEKCAMHPDSGPLTNFVRYLDGVLSVAIGVPVSRVDVTYDWRPDLQKEYV